MLKMPQMTMPLVQKTVVLSSLALLAACGGGGGGGGNGGGGPDTTAFNANFAAATAANGGVLANAEAVDDGGTPGIPGDDTTTATGGFAVSSSGAVDNQVGFVTQESTSTTELTLNGTTYSFGAAGQVATDGRAIQIGSSANSLVSSEGILIGTGTNLDASGTPDTVFAYIRGLETPVSAFPTTGTASYDGTASLATVGSKSTQDGTFILNVPFDSTSVNGSVTIAGASVNGTISGTRDGSGIQGTMTDGGDSLELWGSLFGLAYQEFGGAAAGNLNGTDSVIMLNGELD